MLMGSSSSQCKLHQTVEHLCGLIFCCIKILREIQLHESGLVIMNLIKINEDIW